MFVLEWNTRLTELLGCKYPIMQGAFAGFGTWEFAAAVSKADACGCITASVYGKPEKLREAIQNMRKAVGGKPFTVNISIGICRDVEGMLNVCIDERVPAVETAAYKPDEYINLIRKAQNVGVRWIHKAATLNFVKHAEKLGADAVILVGLDGYGFKNIRQLPTFTSIAWASRHIKIPLVAAGGIGDARTFLAALAAGADGAYIGSAFMATKECPLPENVKEMMVMDKTPDDPSLIFELVAPPKFEEYEKVMRERNKLSLEVWLPKLEAVMLKHHNWETTTNEQSLQQQLKSGKIRRMWSFTIPAYVDRVVTVEELIKSIVEGAEKILEDWFKKFKF